MFRFNGCFALLVIFTWIGSSNGWNTNRERGQNNFNGRYNNDYYGDRVASYEAKNIEKDEKSNKERQLDSKTTESEKVKKELIKLPENGQLFEGDMVMDGRLRNAVLGQSKRAVLKEDTKWPDGVLFYDIDPDFLPIGRELLKKAIYEFESRTCIKFKRRTTETDYVYYTSKENVCSSFIGRSGGKQDIHIGKDCMVLGTVIHETMHALGFIHEHSRPDRDRYLNVKWENIEQDEWSNFNKYTFNDVSDENVEYNFASLMHYRNDAFTRNGKDTLVAKEEEGLNFGQRIKFSVGDVNGINHFYDCQARISKPNYRGLFKDYSGKKKTSAGHLSSETEKRLETLLNRFQNEVYDWQQQKNRMI